MSDKMDNEINNEMDSETNNEMDNEMRIYVEWLKELQERDIDKPEDKREYWEEGTHGIPIDKNIHDKLIGDGRANSHPVIDPTEPTNNNGDNENEQ